ncbi:Holliday junction branch migration protein RuvA [Kangiella koreensis]|uniref:Holliday junction branch migration complex subunit RuvA n=1 Tax=Kangiella koreensis (strain DSM 16069 / JCM 12317 / KCTC 12182 / SW-125) TaxID=523791 RepID=C7R5V1_KANKD|nr:Holliday junction branch migration protein RuvA [Kangiella koreensis]ACV27275.1 Holliday junction DNA helicase RuvA [Kangiella koreensis DSM 16069]
MIGRIRGTLIEKIPPFVIIETTAGVGYEIQVPMTTFYQLPEEGEQAILSTHMSIAENLHALYGFISTKDRALFRELIKVNGVGPKLALAILSGMETDEFVMTVHDGNVDRLVKLPGVGKKTAERLLVEMSDRLKDWSISAGLPSSQPSEASIAQTAKTDASQEAVSALIALGYKPQIASKAVTQVAHDDAKSEELIRLALRQLAS